MTFLVIQFFLLSPYFRKIDTFPLFRKKLNFPYFLHFPYFRSIYACFASPVLTMMYCIMRYTRILDTSAYTAGKSDTTIYIL